MMRVVLLPIVALMLAGCATGGDPKPAVCDGKHRRPANPYGSVLPIAPAAAAATSAGPSGTSAQPKPPASAALAPGPQSSIDPKAVLPCGGRA